MDENSFKENANLTQNNQLIPSQLNLLNTINLNIIQEGDIDFNNNDLLISKIFKTSEKNNEIIPVLNKQSNTYFKKLIEEIPNFADNEELYLFILNKIQFFNKLKEIIDNSYELLYIIFDYLSSYDLSPFNYLIELYIKYILMLNNNVDKGDEIINKNKTFLLTKINDILSWFISCGLIKKNNIDFLFQKIAEFQLYNKLTIKLFTDLISLIEIVYGNSCDYLLVNNFIAKKYIYLYDKENSEITTNITQNNPIINKKGFTLLMWFYLNNNENNNQCTLCQIELDGNKKVEFILNENFDIDIIYDTNTIFREKDNKIFNLKQKKWTQFKIQINDNDIKLYLTQKNNENQNNEEEIKTYLITKEKKENENDNKNYIDFQNSNFIITLLKFYVGFVGYTSYIIFFNSINNENLDSFQLEQNLKIRELLKNKNALSDIYFIFDPNFYLYENNKFVYSLNNVTGELGHNSTNMNQLNLNSVLNFHNYTKNIYYLGGCKNILPLFEILYKLSINYNLTEKDLIVLSIVFQRLLKLMEIIFIDKRKNCIEVYKYETFFFESLRLFLEKINEKLYTINNENSMINSFMNIGNYFSSLISNDELKEDDSCGLFNNILFNPKIIIKFPPESQKKIINFFIEIYNKNINLLMTIENITALLLSITKKCYQIYDFKLLFNYIKIIFESSNISDNEREYFFLMYRYEKISDEIFIYIIQVFCDYFKIKNDKDELKRSKKNSIKIILSNDFFIENLLYFFSNKNILIKKAILNFVFILSQEYNIVLEEYFNKIAKDNQKNKNKDINERITKEEFFNFIKENFLPELTNIQEENEYKITLKKKRINSISKSSSKIYSLDNYSENINIKKEKITNLKKKQNTNLFICSNKKLITNLNKKRAHSGKNDKIKGKINSCLSKKLMIREMKIDNIAKKNNEKNNNEKKNDGYLSKFIIDDTNTNIRSSSKNFEKYNNLRKRKSKSSISLNADFIKEKTEELISDFPQNIRNLAEHCVNFILDIDIDEICCCLLYNNRLSLAKEKSTKNYFKNNTHESKNSDIIKSISIKNYRQKSVDNLNLKQKCKIYLNDYKYNEQAINQKTKSEIVLTLNDWLICLINTEKNKNNIELINWIVNILIKFMYNSKELKVIYTVLFIIMSHKGLFSKTTDKILNENYSQVSFYLMNNKNSVQLLEELTIISFVGKVKEETEIIHNENLLRKFKFISDPLSIEAFNNEKECLENIFDISFRLLKHLIFSKFDIFKNNIINDICNMIIKLSGVLENKKGKIYFKFLNILFQEMCKFYHDKFITLKTDIERESLMEDYIGLLSIFCKYSIIKNITNYYLNNKSNLSFKMDNIISPYLISRILYDNEKSDWSDYIIFDKIITDLKVIFSINELFKLFGIKNNSDINNENNMIIKYNSKAVNKLIKCIIENQSSPSVLKKKFEYLFKTCQMEENNIELIFIITLFYNNSLYILFSETKIIEKSLIELIKLLNDFQCYIIFLLLICCNMREEEQLKQNIIYYNLIVSIRNIILRVNNNTYGQYFIDTFYNILNVISKIYLIQTNNTNTFKKIFTKNINLEKTAAIKLIDYYIKLDDYFFNKNNFNIFAESFEKGVSLINGYKKVLFNIFSKSNSFEININNSENVVINFKRFGKIYNEKLNIIKEIKFLILNKKIEVDDNKSDEYYNLFSKINKLKKPYNNTNKIKNFQKQFFAIKNYKKMKKNLYSFNNSYSNLPIFYPDKVNSYNKKNKTKLLKYKISNFLSKDMTRKFLSPIIDIKTYILNFRAFDYNKNNIYRHSKDKIYTVDLNIFTNYSSYPQIPNNSNQSDSEKYFIIENICYIKTTHHISGIIFIEKNKDSCFYFCIKELESHNILVLKKPDYDSLNKSCFGSLFRNNKNKKDINTYIKINFKDIIFIFYRKYCFRNNSIEIFLTNHRSYYFKFESKEKRNIFVDYILNILKKKLFKPIKSIDHYNKPKVLGFYKDINHNKDYSNIDEIKHNWKHNKISTLEYLMWINIYGNRSFRDIMQYPVFPWILNNYNFNTVEELYNNFNNIQRSFNTPVGMCALDEKSERRREGYILCYRGMVNDLIENGFNIELDSNEENISNISDKNNNENNNNNENKKKKLKKIPKYKFNIEDLFNNKNIEKDIIPYFYGSHYNNPTYVSHYLMRLFPYPLTMIEIQSNGFDSPDRLFLSLQRTFNSVSHKKGDLRELIPEFFTIPELFINLNRFNFGEVNITGYEGDLDQMEEIAKKYINKESGTENEIYDNIKRSNTDISIERRANIEDVVLPKWCSKNPYLFIEKYREFLEFPNININPWIDLIFGCCQRGIKAQNSGNIFPPYSYDGVIDIRVSEEDVLKDRENFEFQLKFFELGVNPTKVFSEQLKDSKKIIQQIPIIVNIDKVPIFNINKTLNDSKVKYIKNINNSFNDIFIIDDKFLAYEFVIRSTVNNNFTREYFRVYKDIKIKNIIEINPIIGNLIIKTICNAKIILLAGFYDGSLYIINSNMKSNDKENNYYEISNKLNDENKNLLNLFGRGLITALEISKDEKYLVYGTNKGTIVIFSLDFFSDNNKIDLLKIIPSHIGYKINSIYVSSDLNVFGDCAYDGYVHLYTLPNCKLINSIYIKNYFIDFIFLSAQPLASIILYSNINNVFKCYNINGHDLGVKENDKDPDNTQKISSGDENMTSPIVFTDYQFIDYLLYIFGNRFIILRKMPSMESFFKVDFSETTFLSMINISLCKKYIYAVDKNSNEVYIVETEKNS